MVIDLPLLWGGLIAFAVIMYVLMDGFDLGIGILFPFAPSDGDRDTMMNSVAPIWDGNETWLILGGSGLLAAFPLAYAVILPALYLPVLLMLVALIFRGVAFEFRFKANRSRPTWDAAFHYGSLLATFAQGVVLGTFVQGVPVVNRQYAGGSFEWLTPFSLLTGVALVAGYALLGSTWTIMKSEGQLQDWARRVSLWLILAVAGFMAVVSLWVPSLGTPIEERWFSWPNIAYLSPVPVLVVATTIGLIMAVQAGREVLPFVLSLVMFLLGFVGLAISLWPNVVPPGISIWEAASPPSSQLFLLVGYAISLPTTLLYTAYVYWVFRGKVGHNAGYH